MNITFLHIDLGIGGAERLIVDAAVALKKQNHSIRIITSHHDKSHCFTETADGTIPVTVVGDWLPRSILGKCAALCAYIRMLYAAFYLIFFSNIKTDIVVCDQISVCIPVLRLKIKKVIYYCHFPDLLLSQPGTILKKLYRMPLNYFEELTTGLADVILVNSEFTRNTFNSTFRNIDKVPAVLYPSVNTQLLDATFRNCDSALPEIKLNEHVYFLSINRYEKKKNITLAIKSFSLLESKLNHDQWLKIKLIIAGGYDLLVHENIEYFKELQKLAKELNVFDKIIFLKSPTDSEKIKLLKYCRCVLYTPENEHFGIVPLEGMYCEKLIIAANSGGPKETIIHRKTGFLCFPDSETFSEAMVECVLDEKLCRTLGEAAKKRFDSLFSFQSFSEKLNDYVVDLTL